jgi:HprK-related kinase A
VSCASAYPWRGYNGPFASGSHVSRDDRLQTRLIVEDLSPVERRRLIKNPGLRLRIGPLVVVVRSPIDIVRECVGLHYASHEVVTDEVFGDLHLTVRPPNGPRRWLKPTALFQFEETLAFQPLPTEQAFAMFEWGLNWAIAAHCHQYLIIHSAVVERNGGALLLPAPPGSGKSTLCAALVARGWRLLSDELALIDMETGQIVPLPRPISLKNQSIEVMRNFWPESSMSEVVHKTIKGSVVHVRPPAPSVRQSDVHASPRWIISPRFAAGQDARLEARSKSSAFMQLVENAFNYSTHGRVGFEALTGLVDQSECFEFTYDGELDAAVGIFDELASRRFQST